MPNGGTPDNVTYNQTLADASNLECGVWYQADTYLVSEAAKFTADGILTLGEDYQNDSQRGAISWHFVYGGDCVVIPPQPADETTVITDCADGVVNTTTITTIYDEGSNTWVPQPPSVSTRPATAEECPIVTPPTEPTPTPTPSSGDSSGSSTPTPPQQTFDTGTQETVSSDTTPLVTQELAETGKNDVLGAWLFWIGITVIVVGGGLLYIHLSRKEKQ